MNILVTGGSGWTAEPILQTLVGAGHGVLVLDPQPATVPTGATWMRGDVRDPAACEAAVAECDAVLHMAIATGEDAYRSPDLPFAVNVRGTWNVFEAARRTGARRMVLIGSAAVHLSDPPPPGGWRSDAGEDHLYDVTKRLQEQIALDFADTHDLSVLILRAGHVVDGEARHDARGRPLEQLAYCRGGWVCRHDLATACARAFATDVTGILDIVGGHPGRERFGTAEAERRLGFRMRHDFAAFAPDR